MLHQGYDALGKRRYGTLRVVFLLVDTWCHAACAIEVGAGLVQQEVCRRRCACCRPRWPTLPRRSGRRATLPRGGLDLQVVLLRPLLASALGIEEDDLAGDSRLDDDSSWHAHARRVPDSCVYVRAAAAVQEGLLAQKWHWRLRHGHRQNDAGVGRHDDGARLRFPVTEVADAGAQHLVEARARGAAPTLDARRDMACAGACLAAAARRGYRLKD